MDNRQLKLDLFDIYDQWHKYNKQKILNEELNLINEEILLNPEEDIEKGLNLIGYLSPGANDSINHNIIPFIEDVIKDKGFIIPDESRHITVLDLIPYNLKFSIAKLRELNSKYQLAIDTILKEFKKDINIEIDGIFISPDGLTLQGYPMDTSLLELREHLYEELKLNNLEINKNKIETAYISLVKFYKYFDPYELISTIENFRNYPMGYYRINEIALNISSRYDKSRTIEIIEKYHQV